MTKLKVTKPSASASALALPSASMEPWRRPDWQGLWLASQARPWRSLALVPAGPGAPPEMLVHAAVTLARTGMVHLGTPIHVADATRITLAQLAAFTDELEHYAQQNSMIVLALPALGDNVTSLSLAQSADKSLLMVLMEKMAIADAKKTVEKVGAQRFIGSVVLKPGDWAAP